MLHLAQLRSWESKWRYYQDNLIQATVLGQQCFTYKPDQDDKANKNQVTTLVIRYFSTLLQLFFYLKFAVELNINNIEHTLGYIHSKDSIQHAFLHKSSIPQFHIPYNNSKLPPTTLPNHYTFNIKSQVIHDFEDQSCTMSSIDDANHKKCYINKLEEKLNCRLHWDHSNEFSGRFFS